MSTRPVWAEISRRSLVENYRKLQSLAGPGADLLAVVKANAYGHGILECAPLLVDAGARWIGVTCVEEGVRVRAVCPGARVLVMSGIWQGEAEAAIEHRLTPVVWEQFHLDLLEAAAAGLKVAPQSLPVHIEIDTGMSRQGVRVAGSGTTAVTQLLELLSQVGAGSSLRVEALMTHFSAPEVLDGEATRIQRSNFIEAIEAATAVGMQPRWVSVGNSATILGQSGIAPLEALSARIGARLLLRPGLALYGYPPRFERSGGQSAGALQDTVFQPVLAWKTRVTSLRDLASGEGAGYNSTFRAARPSRLALLPCGYADGVNRLLSNRGSVLIRGLHAPIAGRVSMDQTIVDVTDVPGASIGDEVVLIGRQGGAAISAWEIADQIGTIPYEVLCGINLRVPRVLVP
ncbi:MAG TPA: alanine racemase [Acidisarcina sp.]